MTGASHDLSRLGRALARAQDAELERMVLTTRERLLEAPPASPSIGQGVRWRGAGAALRWLSLAAAAALLLVVGYSLWRPAPVTFVVGDSSVAGGTDDWLAAPASGTLPIRFSDGSTLTLAAHSRARVVATSSNGATVVVERGSVEADVVHRAGARWGVRVGPYEVRVHGTHFSASWDPEGERLTVVLTEGALEVSGPGIEQGRQLSAGSRLDAHAPERQVAVVPISSQAVEASAGDSSEPSSDSATEGAGAEGLRAGSAGGSEAVATQGQGGASSPAGARAPSWRVLFQAGRHREALGRAKAEGFERLCREADAADLMALADSARFGGSPGHAVTALTALRSRFPADGRASVAAFLLGSIAFDHVGNHDEAVRWFEIYLAEQPSGALAREAMGRLLEAAVRRGSADASRAAATRYLASYPSGPHADQARRILEPGPADGERLGKPPQ